MAVKKRGGRGKGCFDWRKREKRLRCQSRMKNFFTSMLGALVALFIFTGGAFVLFVGFVGAIAAMGGGEKATPEFEKGAYLVFDLSTNITDAPPAIDFGSLGGGRIDTL